MESIVMATILLIRGGEIELHPSENFNKIRHRANKAKKMLIDYQNGNIDGQSKGQKFEPAHVLSFRTAAVYDDNDEVVGSEEGGRISIDVENYIGVMSTDPKDVGGGGNHDDEEYDEEEAEGEEEGEEEEQEEDDEEEEEEG
jgi:hypothetical protein